MRPEFFSFRKKQDTETAKVRLDLIGQIAVGMAHEIRNPLTVIKGYLQFQRKKSKLSMDESFGVMFQELSRIESLITNFISLSRNKAIEKSPNDLNYILTKIYPGIQSYAARHSTFVHLSLTADLPMLDLNADEIEQLIINLAYNGIEAMQPKGNLTIGTIGIDSSNNVILYINDEGSGIPPEQMDQIFDPFYTTKATNTGLGLAIVLSIIDRHRGQIEIFSQVGVGTKIQITFPVIETTLPSSSTTR